eukprot:s2133_g8.t1
MLNSNLSCLSSILEHRYSLLPTKSCWQLAGAEGHFELRFPVVSPRVMSAPVGQLAVDEYGNPFIILEDLHWSLSYPISVPPSAAVQSRPSTEHREKQFQPSSAGWGAMEEEDIAEELPQDEAMEEGAEEGFEEAFEAEPEDAEAEAADEAVADDAEEAVEGEAEAEVFEDAVEDAAEGGEAEAEGEAMEETFEDAVDPDLDAEADAVEAEALEIDHGVEELDELDAPEVPEEFEELQQVLDEKPPSQPWWLKRAFWQVREYRYVLRLRQKMRTAKDAEAFCDELAKKIEEAKGNDQMLVFEDFDISQNHIPNEQIEMMFSLLTDTTVQIERLRAFGIPTLDDAAAVMLSGWLQGVVPETAPRELHLSDCAITAVGFKAIMEALSENGTFPADDPKKPDEGKLPVYLRIEDNYIDNSIIQESIDEGVATAMKKKDKIEHSDTVKCRILIRGDEKEDNPYKQKEGEPPDPADAPPPKQVRDKGKGKGRSGKGTKGSKGRNYQYWGASSRKDSEKGGKGGKWERHEYHTPKPRSEYSEWQSSRKVTYKDSNDKPTNKWSKDSTWGRESKQTKYDNKSYDKYDNKSYDNYGKNEKYEKNNSKDSWSKQSKDDKWNSKQSKDDKWNSSKWDSKQDSNRNDRDDKWKSSGSKSWESNSWEKQGVAAYSGGRSQAQNSQKWDSKGSWKEDSWKKSSDSTENGRGSHSYGHAPRPSPKTSYSSPSTSSVSAVPRAAQSKISEAERSRRWADRGDSGKGKSWSREDGSRNKNGKDSKEGGGKSQSSKGKGQGRSKSEPFTAFRAPTRGSAAEMTRKRPGSSEAPEGKRQKTSAPAGSGRDSLPPNWEKHWSDQYGTHYYWNKETGQSTWDVPTA